MPEWFYSTNILGGPTIFATQIFPGPNILIAPKNLEAKNTFRSNNFFAHTISRTKRGTKPFFAQNLLGYLFHFIFSIFLTKNVFQDTKIILTNHSKQLI